jgi:hypothetical protein
MFVTRPAEPVFELFAKPSAFHQNPLKEAFSQ